MADLLSVIKKAATDAVAAGSPVTIQFGVVTGEAPLEINVEQKLTLTAAQLVLTRNVTDHEVMMEVNHTTQLAGNHSHSVNIGNSIISTEDCQGHNHSIIGTKKVKLYHHLKKGENVLLMRFQGGQRYVVIDRVVNI